MTTEDAETREESCRAFVNPRLAAVTKSAPTRVRIHLVLFDMMSSFRCGA
jgi:hypothetical protein